MLEYVGCSNIKATIPMMFTCDEYEHEHRGTAKDIERDRERGSKEKTTLSFGIGPAQTMDVHIEVHDTIADSEIKDGNKKPNNCRNSSTHFGGMLSYEIPFLSQHVNDLLHFILN